MADSSPQASDAPQRPSNTQEILDTAPATGTSQAPARAHIEQLPDADGGTFYANHSTRTNTWRHPNNEDAGLPVGWEALVDSECRTYYVDHASRTSTFTRPEGLARDGELPKGWEILRTDGGVAYFVDHTTHTASWEDPRRL